MNSTSWPIRALRVLVADSDTHCARHLMGRMEQMGWQAKELKEGESPAEAVQRDSFEMVLLGLPSNEAAVAGQLDRIRAADKHVCVIALTESQSMEPAVAAMRHSAFHVLRKPVEEAELSRAVADAVRAKGLCVTPEQDLNTVIGSRVRERRNHEALTLREVSRMTGLSVSLISQVELGKSAASISTLHKLAAALKVPMAHFVETL